MNTKENASEPRGEKRREGMTLEFREAYYLPSGRVFLLRTDDGHPIECTEMRDVSVDGKEHAEVRNSQDPHVIWKHLRPYGEKWLLTVSTQKGCPHNCRFCDVADLGFGGNLSQGEIEEQIRFLLNASPYVTATDKAKIGFARIGEPSHNLNNVLGAMRNLPRISEESGKDFRWLPCFNSILPRKTLEGRTGFDVIDKVMDLKEGAFGGFLHFQVSCNSTDESVRKELFGGASVLTLEEVIGYVNAKTVTNRTVTLNFIVMEGVPLDVSRLVGFGIDKGRFTVKLIPLNGTMKAEGNGLRTFANYGNYERLVELGDSFRAKGIPVVTDAIAKCEEAGLCCGQLAHVFAGEKTGAEPPC